MKSCPSCKKTYDDDANFCPEEVCATPDGPRRLLDMSAPASVERFQKIARLGGSRTGEVWRARDSQSGAEVAYKIIAASVIPNAAAAARVERELRQLMRVQSPFIATVIDTGKTASGDLYVALELCAGETLDRVLSRGPVDLERAKQIVAQIGAGLLEAQKAGIVHRDLAPKNVLVSASGDCKIINFPVAVPINDKLSGVAEYASPEQGQGRPVDQRSNTYSLACILYHLLTGEPPFVGADPVAVFGLHGSSPVLAPSQRRAAAGLTADVDATILKALDKNSSRRQLTLRLFLSEVEALKAAPKASAPQAAQKDVGYAKTMLFTGGSQDVQAIVQKALAEKQAKEAAPSSSKSVTPAPAAAAQPAPVAAPAQNAEVTASSESSATASASAPSVSGVSPAYAVASRLTPPPVTPDPTKAMPEEEMDPVEAARKKAAATAAASAPGGKGAAFRETLWFKKGDVEQMVAEAKAKAKAAGEEDAGVPTEDIRPIEDRYRDDGTLTVEDRKKFSLRTGGTAANMPTVKGSIGGPKMSAADIMDELGGGKKTGVYVAVVVAVILVIGAILFALGKGANDKKTPESTAVAAPTAPVAVPAAPAAPAKSVTPTPAPTTVAEPVNEAAEGEETAPTAAAKAVPKKKNAPAKKPVGKSLAKKPAGKK